MSAPAAPGRPTILARHGARAHVEANTVEAFRLALRLGADGVALDAWRLDAGPVVVATSPTVRHGWRRRPVTSLDPVALPPDVVALADVVATLAPPIVLLVVVDGVDSARAVIDTLAGAARLDGLWLVADDIAELVVLRDLAPAVKLLARTRLVRLREGPERHAATLAAGGADGVVMHQADWTGGLVALYHRFELLAVAEDAQHERVLRDLVRMEIDAIVTDWPDRAVDALAPRLPPL
jgi:glycerophosphoryl diester phosphodiesterase